MKSYQLAVEPEDELLSALDDFPILSASPSASNDDISQWTLEFGVGSTGAHAETDLENLSVGDADHDPLQAIHALIETVRQRHAHDPATIEALDALEDHHLPQALAYARSATTPRRLR